ncbi:hypothetical protein CC1G_05397 [Coprinopsis cinerea okayama7|uniref:Uncharacterized protein n=1 Tax=Coprinopsis cinerea (strain Okayama-7 / 130 / ATCC MYA-4618 / FGSC 9003) TaxID=240176 RepID=A8NPY8_COPC7|nr:hypothetical protein CC1G_05397 [Coprinopsis cinerea okayama7\|eukprot:XP_001835435.2 hypothetical protein CC1G_05397 [Coprinopsis cinerea okayama7\
MDYSLLGPGSPISKSPPPSPGLAIWERDRSSEKAALGPSPGPTKTSDEWEGRYTPYGPDPSSSVSSSSSPVSPSSPHPPTLPSAPPPTSPGSTSCTTATTTITAFIPPAASSRHTLPPPMHPPTSALPPPGSHSPISPPRPTLQNQHPDDSIYREVTPLAEPKEPTQCTSSVPPTATEPYGYQEWDLYTSYGPEPQAPAGFDKSDPSCDCTNLKGLDLKLSREHGRSYRVSGYDPWSELRDPLPSRGCQRSALARECNRNPPFEEAK